MIGRLNSPKRTREITDEEGRKTFLTTPTIGHPRDGWKLTLHPHRVDGLDRYEYEHPHSGGRIRVEVLYRHGRYAIVQDLDYDGLVDPVWIIHEHYRTGLTLYARTPEGEWALCATREDLENVGIELTPGGLAAAITEGRLSPEAIGPHFGSAARG